MKKSLNSPELTARKPVRPDAAESITEGAAESTDEGASEATAENTDEDIAESIAENTDEGTAENIAEGPRTNSASRSGKSVLMSIRDLLLILISVPVQ